METKDQEIERLRGVLHVVAILTKVKDTWGIFTTVTVALHKHEPEVARKLIDEARKEVFKI